MEANGLAPDTDVLVSDLRGKTSFLQNLEDKDLSTIVVNALELFHGAHKSKEKSTNLPATRGLLMSLKILGFDLEIAERAGEVLAKAQKAGEDVEIRELLIGCIARDQGIPLLTYNVKHFRKIPGLRVIDAAKRLDEPMP